jgi:hypothetical protein
MIDPGEIKTPPVFVALNSISFLTFNLAHWIFAFSYLALSYRVEMKIMGKSTYTLDCRLNAVNIVVSVLNVAFPVMGWICSLKDEWGKA